MSTRWFSDAELACRCQRPSCKVNGIDPAFGAWLDRLREALAHPLTLTSAYRCPEHDSSVSGKGAHTAGKAADIVAISGSAKHEIVGAALTLGATGIGVGSTFVHADIIKPGGKYPRPVIWTYPTRSP
jgi:uncharacterized protein YcbK (DUF882 family)